jgi:rubrerythrin
MGMEFDFSMLQPMDILDMAIWVEAEAEGHYEQLASWAEGSADPQVVKFLTRMAGLEALHRQQIQELRQRKFGDDYDKVYDNMSMRQALEIALEAEGKAHDYYAGAQEYISDSEALTLLEGLRKAELEHQRLLRDEISRLG